MLEQQLINAFMKLTAKVGAGDLVRELVQAVDNDGNPKNWNPSEMAQAIDFINVQVERFGQTDAVNIIQTLMKKYNISNQELTASTATFPEETTGVQGLQ